MNEPLLRARRLLLGDEPAQGTLLQLCHSGRLRRGLSVSLRVTPDEVLSALCAPLGLSWLKVLDVREQPDATQLEVRLQGGRVEKWKVKGVVGLVKKLNALTQGATKWLVLGEHEGMLQLWCLDDADARAVRSEM